MNTVVVCVYKNGGRFKKNGKKEDTKPCCMAGVSSTVICTFYILDLKWIADAMWNMNLFYVTMMSQVNNWFQRHLTVDYFVALLN